LNPGHEQALAAIRFGVSHRKGLIVISGPAGLGKTIVLRSYLKTLDQKQYKPICMGHPHITFEALVMTMLKELGVEPTSTETSGLVRELHEVLLAQSQKNTTVILFIDDAHNIPPDTLEALGTLCSLQTLNEKLLQIVLIGQPALEKLLSAERFRLLRASIALHARLEPLTKRATLWYIEHRLYCTGCTVASVFSPGALKIIARYAHGNPRSINRICDHALMAGVKSVECPISGKTAKHVVKNLDQKETVANISPYRGNALPVTTKALAMALFFGFGLKDSLDVTWPGSKDAHNASMGVFDSVRQSLVSTPRNREPQGPPTAQEKADMQESQIQPVPGQDASTQNHEFLVEEKADLTETARLLAVLLDCGRVVVGRVQPTINNPRLEDKGFSSSVFEAQLRKEFLTRTGHDLRNLASGPMPERARLLLVRLSFFMQKAVQDVQPEINKKGIGFKGFIPATFGTQVAAKFTKDTGVQLRQIGPPATAPRNPNNRPDESEERALLIVQKSHPRVGDHVVVQELPNNSVRVLLPLFYSKACLSCHGKPKGEIDISGYEKEGFKEGDLGGAISVSVPTATNSSKDRKP
jgi:general secretion pathway protein A